MAGARGAARLPHLFKFALATGLRSGELLALRWSDVHLLRSEVEIQRTLTPDGETAPKSGEARTVDLTPGAAGVLGDWFKLSGAAESPGGLVFEKETGGHLDASYLTKGVLYKAMNRAGIPREGERGRARTFHSLAFVRATGARERGGDHVGAAAARTLLDLTLTVDVMEGGRGRGEGAGGAARRSFPIRPELPRRLRERALDRYGARIRFAAYSVSCLGQKDPSMRQSFAAAPSG